MPNARWFLDMNIRLVQQLDFAISAGLLQKLLNSLKSRQDFFP